MPHLFRFLHKVNDKFILIKLVLAMSASFYEKASGPLERFQIHKK